MKRRESRRELRRQRNAARNTAVTLEQELAQDPYLRAAKLDNECDTLAAFIVRQSVAHERYVKHTQAQLDHAHEALLLAVTPLTNTDHGDAA